MKIKFLGAHNLESKNTRNTTIIIDDIIAIDAGCLASELTFAEQEKIDGIFLTHGHYDHIKEIPAYAFNNLKKTTKVFGNSQTLEILKTHLVDGLIYPNFTKKNHFLKIPVLKLIKIKPNIPIKFENYEIKPIPVEHLVISNGFEIKSDDGNNIFISGDSGPGLSQVWKNINPELMIIDLTFPNKLEQIAVDSKHLCPNLLKKELISFYDINNYYPNIILTHLNPKFEDEIREEILKISEDLGVNFDFASEGKEIKIKKKIIESVEVKKL